MPRYLIIQADDAGLSLSINRATKEALDAGMVTSASVMAPCPAFGDMVSRLKCTSYDVAVHGTLTSEWPHYRWGPVSCDVASLLNPITKKFYSREIFAVVLAKPEHAYAELSAQIAMIQENLLAPSSVNTHMKTWFCSPGLFSAYLQAADEHALMPMLPSPGSAFVRALQQRYCKWPAKGYAKRMLAELEKAAESRFTLDEVVIKVSDIGLRERSESYKRAMGRLPEGISQISIHAGFDDEETRSIIGPLNALKRYHDYRIFTSDDMRRFLETEGFILASWKTIPKGLKKPKAQQSA